MCSIISHPDLILHFRRARNKNWTDSGLDEGRQHRSGRGRTCDSAPTTALLRYFFGIGTKFDAVVRDIPVTIGLKSLAQTNIPNVCHVCYVHPCACQGEGDSYLRNATEKGPETRKGEDLPDIFLRATPIGVCSCYSKNMSCQTRSPLSFSNGNIFLPKCSKSGKKS